MHTIDQLIGELQAAREVLGGDAEVRVAYQRAYPIRLGVTGVRASEPPPAPANDFGRGVAQRGRDGEFCWLTAEPPAAPENPYGPAWAWS